MRLRYFFQLALGCGLALFASILSANAQSPASSKSPDASQSQGKVVTDEPDSRADEGVSDEMKLIIGDYRIVEGRAGNAQILPERLADVNVKITAKSITTYDGERRQRFNATYKLDAKQKPWRLQMTPVEVAVPVGQPKQSTDATETKKADSTTGLIVVDPKTSQVKLIYALPGGAEPKDFKVQENQHLFVLERLQTPKESTRPKATPEKDSAPQK